MALEFPSWLEWLEWLVGADWPHGNEDRMWQMSRELEGLADEAEGLIDDLDSLISDIDKKYPGGVGGDAMFSWLTPLRYGEGGDVKNGSLKSLADNYRSLAKAADSMGDELESAKLNFYIAGAWLVAELAWAAASGPFAPALHGTIIGMARIAFRQLGIRFGTRIASLLGREVGEEVFERFAAKLVYEILQEAAVETFQGTSQELLVQYIQNKNGHVEGYDWNKVGTNAAISAIAGAGGGAVGATAGKFLPTDMGGWKGALNGAITGGLAGAGGAGAAWLGQGAITGNWDFDPRSLTGGVFSGAGPSALYGMGGESDFGGPMGDGTRQAPQNEPESQNEPQSDPEAQGGPESQSRPESQDDSQDDSAGTQDDSAETDDRTEPAGPHTTEDGPPSNNGETGGPQMQPASGVTPEAPPARDAAPPAQGDNESQSPNGVAGGGAGQGRSNAETNLDADAEAQSESSSRPSNSGSPSGGSSDTGGDGSTSQPDGPAPSPPGGQGDSHVDGANSPEASGESASKSDGSPSDSSKSDSTAHEPKTGATQPNTGETGTATNGNGATPNGGTGAVGTPTGAAPAAMGTPAASGSPSVASGSPTAVAGSPSGSAASPSTPAATSGSSSPTSGTPAQPTSTAATPTSAQSGTAPQAQTPGGSTPSAADPKASSLQSGSPDGTVGATPFTGVTPQQPGLDVPLTETRSAPSDLAAYPGTGSPIQAAPTGVDAPTSEALPDPTAEQSDTSDTDPILAIAPVLPDTRPAPDGTDPTRGNNRPDRGTASSVGDFDGNARPTKQADLTDARLRQEIDSNLLLITPADVAFNQDSRQFVLPDGRTVQVTVAPIPDSEITDSSNADESARKPVADFVARPDGSGYDVRVSPRARDQDIVRAVAHELAEIRLALDPAIDIDPNSDRPAQPTTHQGGRFAEIRVLTSQIDRATFDPARAPELPGLRRDLADLTDRLGFNDPDHADTVRQQLTDHDPGLARRLELEHHGLLDLRPTANQQTSESDYDDAADQHLDRLRQQLAGDFVDDVVRADAMALNGRMREELARRVFDPIFDDPNAKPARATIDGDELLNALDPVNEAINDPNLDGPARADAVHRAIDRFRDSVPAAFRDTLGPDAFTRMHDAAEALRNSPNRIPAVLDHTTGRLTVDGQQMTLADFLHATDHANRGAAANGVDAEYTVVIHDPVDGRSSVDILSRPRPQHRLPLPQNVFGPDNEAIAHQPRPAVPASARSGHTIDVGVGRGAFAVEMTPATDRSGGGLVVQTELAEKAVAGQRRRNLGVLDPGPLTRPGSVMVFGDLLFNGHLLGDIARIYINNVSAKLPDSVYTAMAEELARTLAPGGRVELQWDMRPEEEGGRRGDRGHIDGEKLWHAMQQLNPGGPTPFRVEENTVFPPPGNTDYYYTIDAATGNVPNAARMATIIPPQPERRMVIVYEPDTSAAVANPDTASRPEHGTASPVGEFHGDARPSGTTDLDLPAVVDRISDNIGLIAPENVTWNRDTNQFQLRLDDGRTIPVNVHVGPTTDNAVADFTARTDDSGNLTGYDINVSPRARDQDIVRAIAHELAEISLSQDPDVLTDPDDDRPSRFTNHLGGRYAEMRVLIAQIDEIIASRDKVRARELPGLRLDLNDLIEQVGLRDPEHAPTAERILGQQDSDLAPRIYQLRTPVEGILHPAAADPDAELTPHDLGRIRQLRTLAEQAESISPPARQSDADARAEHDAVRREALALVERLGLREGTPGANARREKIAERLNERTREQVDRLLSDIGRRDSDLADADREFVDQVRTEIRAIAALDHLSDQFHGAVHRAHVAFRKQNVDNVGPDNIVVDPDSNARWYSWPPGQEMSTTAAPVPDIGLPTDPAQLREHWSNLSDAEKDALYRADPYLGNRNGIPQVDRDHYNRQTLEALREQTERDYDDARVRQATDQELKPLSDRLGQIGDMLTLLDSTHDGLPHLLSYVDAKLQYIYALGDPDTADNVAVALAGAFRRRSGVGYAVQILGQLRQIALAVDPSAETSTLLFGAYNNPDSLVATISSQGAEEGAQQVRDFHDGLRATNQRERVNITTIAHSYGGVTGGHAAGHGHSLNTDALVFVGSWGTGVASVADLRLTGVDPPDIADHVFATMADRDSIQLMPPTHGPAPDDPSFGATVFGSDTTPGQTRLGWNPSDHLAPNYFRTDGPSSRALGWILNGQGHLLSRIDSDDQAAGGPNQSADDTNRSAPDTNPPDHGTASPVGEFRGDARPDDAPQLTRDAVIDRIENNLGLITPADIAWRPDTNRFELRLDDGRTIAIDVAVGPTTDNAVADFTARTDDSGRLTGYDINVSPGARDQDVVRAVAHELAEISLAQDPDVLTDPDDDRPSRLTSHLGGRYAEMRVLIAQIDEISASRDRVRLKELPGLRLDLNDLMEQVGLRDPEHAPTAERVLNQHDSELFRRVDQFRMPVEGILRPGAFDSDAQPTPHDLGRIRQLRELAEQLSHEAGHTDPAARDESGPRREALALVERLGLREGTPGANARRGVVTEHLTDRARRQVDELLADVGRHDSALPDTDRHFVDQVRTEARAAAALDFLSPLHTFHIGVLKAHQVYRTQLAASMAADEAGNVAADNIVTDPDSGARWYSWPPGMDVSTASAPLPDVGLPTDPRQLREDWSRLTDAEQDALYRADPYLGNRDGIPQVDRDRYNRQTLAMLREQAVAEQNEERLRQIDDMLSLLDSTQEGLPPYLLSYVDEKLQYIYALGDPDTADNVAIALAGAFRRRSGVGYAVQILQQLRQTALAVDPTAETSVLLFGAYNNPDSLVAGISSQGAEEGAQKVREFHDGLRVTHQGPPANMTTIAHSYGGVTGGHAAGHGHSLDTDALVFIGSFGTGVASVNDLRLTGVDPADIADHVFATVSDYDSALLMPPTQGPEPTDPAYGATVFESNSTPSQTRLGWNPDDHLAPNYFRSDHPSYRSLGLILNGQGHLLNPSNSGDQDASTPNRPAPEPNPPEHGTASPVGEFRGDARPEGTPDLSRDAVLDRIEHNLGLINPDNVVWNPDSSRFQLRLDDGRTLTITVAVGPTTDNAVADFTARTDVSGNLTGYDINVSPRARDQDIVRAVAHELAEISLSQDPNVLTDPDDDRPSRLTSHLGGRFAEVRVLVAQIEEIIASRDRTRALELPGLRRDLHDLLDHLGGNEPTRARTLRQLLTEHDPALLRRLDLVAETPRSEHSRLLQQRKDLARELEFRRAQRDDRIGRLLDVGNPEQALGTREQLQQTVLRLFDETGTRVVGIDGIGEEAPHQERQPNSPEERAHRREALRKLTASAEEVIRLREQIQETERQLHELERAGAGLPKSADVMAELDRLAALRADELLRIKPRRAMRDDLAERLGLVDEDGAVDEVVLGPDRLAQTLEQLRGAHPDRLDTIAALGDAADDVNKAHNRIGRSQDEMARVAGEWRRFAAAEGARMVTDRVAVVDGQQRRIIVFGPRDELGRPFADHDRALADALRHNAAVAQAMVDPQTVVRRVRVTVGRDDQVSVSNHRGPEVNRLLGRDGFNDTRWRDTDGNWHTVDPSRPDWVGNRDAGQIPKSLEPRVLPEGVIGWGADPLQAAVVDVFVDPAIDPSTGQPPHGVNQDLLPHFPGGSDPMGSDTPTYELPFADAASKVMVLIVQAARLSGFTWFSDTAQPTRIRPGFKRPKWFPTGSTEVQPMVREWDRAEHVTDSDEIAPGWRQRRREAAEKWARVQAWADSQYARFRADRNENGPDRDVTAITRLLSEYREVRRRQLAEFIDAANDVATGRAGGDPNKLISKVTRLLGDENADYAKQLATDLRENLGKVDPADRAELGRVLDQRLRAAVDNMLPPAFTTEEIQQIKDHLMREPRWYRDPSDGQWVKGPLDAVADVAEAWNRLIDGSPLPPDILLLQDALAESNFLRDNPTATWRQANAHVAALDGFHWDTARPPLTGDRAGIAYEPGPPTPEHGTASPVGEFRGDARPEGTPDLSREFVVNRIEHNLGLINPDNVVWNPDSSRFQLRLDDGRTLIINVAVGSTTDNAVADFTARTDESGNLTGYDINVSPRARDQDIVRAIAHELAEITLSQDPNVLTDPDDDRPSRLTTHLGGRYAEMRVLIAQIDEISASRDKVRMRDLPGLRLDLADLIEQVGLRDPEHAPTAERVLGQHDSELYRRIDQARIPVEGMLRPGVFDPDAQPTPHDLGRIRQLRSLAEQLSTAGNTDPAVRTDSDTLRREALALVERLGLREGTTGANARRGVVAERLTNQARAQVDSLLADVGRPDTALPDADRQLVDQVRIEARAAAAFDFLSPLHTFHIGVLKAHQVYRTQIAANPDEAGNVAADHIVEDPESGARWYSWPPNMELSTGTAAVPDIGLPADPRQLREHWSALSDAEKDALYRADPFVGSRDGIPQVDRDRYNRRTLATLREQAERNQDEDRLRQIDDMLSLLDSTQAGLPPHLLSYLDEKLQYIYALGDPDTADNVAVALAGAFRRRSGVGYAVQTLQQLRQAALAVDPTAETSVLLFGAYNNPDALVAAISSQGAEEGARKVREFHDGLRVTNQREHVNITTIAHSYGGVTGGHAAGHGHSLNTDALVFIGAFGTGVASVADLRLTGVDPADNADHVFATVAKYDSALLMPPTQGPVPTDPVFGATVFESLTTPSPTRLGWNPDDHLAPHYFGTHNPSFRSLGLIIAGYRHLLR